ncbi:hypothetical protein M422DRAFT_30673 [Sphaerobolus stellatus SS14]|uniref:Uncharacterized protein n=1 Tax=Sphaerobolus stellatus (strain SS14) TaxID=990650 RepID=A0A0C9VYR0_SPHS4|nr:hypothetical protein M422DRAFT_30673 [Sphaerobolus stellatus SS14]
MLQRLARPLKGVVSHGLAPARRIHVPGRIQLTAPTNLSQQVQSLFSHIIGHVEGALNGSTASRSIHSNAASIRSSYSFPTRVALSKPFGAPCLPRAPRVPGHISQVGLGTARNFSSGRPIFQNLVQNVPVAGRAFFELDWDLKMREEQRNAIRRQKKSTTVSKQASKVIPPPQQTIPAPSSVYDEEEMQHYFQAPEAPSVVTYLQIPLAPTPTARVPLSANPVPHLLPLSALAREHALHSKHTIRVSSLFRRLDAANVWERGASCESYGDPSGLCTILQIKFEGWTEEMVREALGTSGRDWCTIQEIYPETNRVESSPMAYSDPWISSEPQLESAVSLVMPTLDTSSPFPLAEEPETFSVDGHDTMSDLDSEISFVVGTESGWDSDMGEFSTPPLIVSELNPEEEWYSLSRSADSEAPVGFVSHFQGAMLFH